MNTAPTSIFSACLLTLLFVGSAAYADPARAGVSEDELKATAERMREAGQKMQQDIQHRLDQLRKERAALVARQSAERRQEAERAQQQAERDRAALAAMKAARQREALAAAQDKARKEAAARVAEIERQRQAELKEKEAQEAALERAQQESLDAYKAGAKQQKLGTQTQFGVDL